MSDPINADDLFEQIMKRNHTDRIDPSLLERMNKDILDELARGFGIPHSYFGQRKPAPGPQLHWTDGVNGYDFGVDWGAPGGSQSHTYTYSSAEEAGKLFADEIDRLMRDAAGNDATRRWSMNDFRTFYGHDPVGEAMRENADLGKLTACITCGVLYFKSPRRMTHCLLLGPGTP